MPPTSAKKKSPPKKKAPSTPKPPSTASVPAGWAQAWNAGRALPKTGSLQKKKLGVPSVVFAPTATSLRNARRNSRTANVVKASTHVQNRKAQLLAKATTRKVLKDLILSGLEAIDQDVILPWLSEFATSPEFPLMWRINKLQNLKISACTVRRLVFLSGEGMRQWDTSIISVYSQYRKMPREFRTDLTATVTGTSTYQVEKLREFHFPAGNSKKPGYKQLEGIVISAKCREPASAIRNPNRYYYWDQYTFSDPHGRFTSAEFDSVFRIYVKNAVKKTIASLEAQIVNKEEEIEKAKDAEDALLLPSRVAVLLAIGDMKAKLERLETNLSEQQETRKMITTLAESFKVLQAKTADLTSLNHRLRRGRKT